MTDNIEQYRTMTRLTCVGLSQLHQIEVDVQYIFLVQKLSGDSMLVVTFKSYSIPWICNGTIQAICVVKGCEAC